MATSVLLNHHLLCEISAYQNGMYRDIAQLVRAWREEREFLRSRELVRALDLGKDLRRCMRLASCRPEIYTPDVIDYMIQDGHYEAIKYLWRCLPSIQCSLNGLNLAVSYGHLNIVAFLQTHDTKCWLQHTIDLACENGHLSILEYLHTHLGACGATKHAMNRAASKGYLEIVQFLHIHRNEGCTTEAMDLASANGHLSVVQFLHANRTEGCTVNAMDGAASSGHLEIVKFLHENRHEGCSTRAMDLAASNGHLHIVKFLHMHRTEGATTLAIDTAAAHGHLEVVQFLLMNRTEMWRDGLSWAKRSGHSSIVSYLESFSSK